MKTFLLSLTAAAALAAAAVPASAQDWRGQSDYGQRYEQGRDNNPGQAYGRGYQNRTSLEGLDWKITTAERNRMISRRDAQELRSELRQVQSIAWKIQSGRANPWERQRFERTVSRIEAAVNSYASNDRRWDNRGGYDNDQRWDGRR